MEISPRKLLILISLWLFCFQVHVGFVRSQCLEDQQSLLLQLKQNLTFYSHSSRDSPKLASWDLSRNCWGGVTCSGSGYVIGLDLSWESILGGIYNSSSLFDLHHLRSLDLAGNYFSNGTRFPSSGIGKLANLRYLNLYDVSFSGQFPVEIYGLTSLVSLNLSSSERLKLNLSMLVRNLTRLVELDLAGTDLSAEGGGWCGALSSLTRLRVLNLAFCDLSGPIDSGLSKLSSLSIITFSGNRKMSGTVPEFLGSFSDLTSLSLADCGLYGNFPEKIFQLPHLQSLDLSSNDGLHGLIPEFPENASLQTLSLSGTSFGGHLPQSIGNLEQLSRIELARCNFSGSIPDTMAKLTQLVSLDFSGNNFSGSIPSFLGLLKTNPKPRTRTKSNQTKPKPLVYNLKSVGLG